MTKPRHVQVSPDTTRMSRCAISLITFAVVWQAAACTANDQDRSASKPERSAPSQDVAKYLDEMLLLAQTHSVHRAQLDWSSVRADVLAVGDNAQDIRTAEPAMARLLELLNDGHSLYQSVDRRRVAVFKPCQQYSVPHATIPPSIGYLRVETFLSGPGSPQEYAQRLQDRIEEADKPGLAGWVVDLRSNRGGDMWSMLLGVGPLLGHGTVGYSEYPAGNRDEWGYIHGAATLAGKIMWEISGSHALSPRGGHVVSSDGSRAPVAVLTSGATVSAGEAIAVAFKAGTRVRSFGEPTCGRSSVNQAFKLSDGAWFFVTTGVMADRTGRSYGGPIEPDEQTPADAALARALEWIATGA